MIVGHALGVRMLGYYTRAYDLVKFPSAVFDNVVGNVLFPAFAKLRANGPLMALNFRRAMFANAIVLLPASAALFVVAPETIRIMMGDGWGDVVLPFRILVVTMMFRTSAKVGQTLASAAGSIRAVAVVNVIYMLAVVGGALASISWGIAGVAVSTAAAITLTFSLFCFLGVRQTALRWSELFLAHLPGLALAAIAAGSSWGIATWLRARHEPAAIVFAASAVASVLSVLAVGMLLIRRGRGDFEWIRTEALRLRRGQ
jgi:PST family polysaccharide transporter